jgi:hypothetical protein
MEAEIGPLPDTEPISTLIFDFYSAEPWEINFYSSYIAQSQAFCHSSTTDKPAAYIGIYINS